MRDADGQIFGTVCHFDPAKSPLDQFELGELEKAAGVLARNFSRDVSGRWRLAFHSDILKQVVDATTNEETLAGRERRLRLDRDFLQMVVDTSFDGIAAVDPMGTIQLWNPVAAAHFGCSREQFNEAWRALLGVSDRKVDRTPVFAHLVNEAMRGRTMNAETVEVTHLGGRSLSLSVTTAPLREHSGEIRGVLIVTRDRTEQIRLEAIANERQQLLALDAAVNHALVRSRGLREILNDVCEILCASLRAASVRIWTHNEPDRVLELEASAGIDTHLDGPRACVPLGTFEIGRIASSRAPHLTNDVLHDPEISEHEWARREGMVAFAGYPLIVAEQLVGVLALFAKQPLSDATLGVLQAVGASVAQAIRRGRSERALVERETWLNTTLTSIGDGVVATDARGNVTFLNPIAEKLTGWSMEEARRKPLDSIFAIFNEITGEAAVNPVSIVLKEGRTVGLANHTVLRHRDGFLTPIEDSAAPIRLGEGPLLGVVLVFRDATVARLAEAEQKRLLNVATSERSEAERLRHVAEDATLAKDQFLARVSHDLRNPLGSILGWAGILRSEHSESTRVGKGLDVIERNAKAQVQLVEDLLDVSRIATGKLKLQLSTIVVERAIEDALDAARFAARAKGVELRVSVDPETGSIVADPERIQQVVWNLASNAVKFTPSGGTVNVAAKRTGSYLEISVDDTGIGIDAKFLPFVFNSFQQADESRERSGGLGLGLAIVRHVVELHGGTVRVNSAGLGKGTRFDMRFPIRAGMRPSESPLPIPLAKSSPILSSVRALVVDDENEAREIVAEILQHAGATVIVAASVAEAKAAMAGSKFDVLISDVGMPEADGYALIRSVRSLANSIKARTPAVALTAMARSSDRMKALSAGFNAHVAKPVEPAELIIVVASLLGKSLPQ